MLSLHVKWSLLLWVHDKLYLLEQKWYWSEMFWYFIGVYNNRWNIAWLLGDMKSLCVLKNISALKEKFHVSAQPCNILYMLFVFMIFYMYIRNVMFIVSGLSKLWHPIFWIYMCIFNFCLFLPAPCFTAKNVAADISAKLCDSVATKLEGKVLGTFSGKAIMINILFLLSKQWNIKSTWTWSFITLQTVCVSQLLY